jgi:4'-phosphopantetheinyl transferase
MINTWRSTDVWPEMDASGVHVWLVHLPSARRHLTRCDEVLSLDERERARRFRFEEHQERSTLSRGILRHLLGRYLDCSPRQLRFEYGPQGKPAVAGAAMAFNLSHSADFAVLAFTRTANVGVDIEAVRLDMVRQEEIAGKYFAPRELEQFMSCPEPQRARAFFQFWSRKEAFVKARGDGILSGLNQFAVPLAQTRVFDHSGEVLPRWTILDLPEVPGCCGAFAVQEPAPVPQFFEWHERWLSA